MEARETPRAGLAKLREEVLGVLMYRNSSGLNIVIPAWGNPGALGGSDLGEGGRASYAKAPCAYTSPQTWFRVGELDDGKVYRIQT